MVCMASFTPFGQQSTSNQTSSSSAPSTWAGPSLVSNTSGFGIKPLEHQTSTSSFSYIPTLEPARTADASFFTYNPNDGLPRSLSGPAFASFYGQQIPSSQSNVFRQSGLLQSFVSSPQALPFNHSYGSSPSAPFYSPPAATPHFPSNFPPPAFVPSSLHTFKQPPQSDYNVGHNIQAPTNYGFGVHSSHSANYASSSTANLTTAPAATIHSVPSFEMAIVGGEASPIPRQEGSRIQPYATTIEPDSGFNLVSISAMFFYKNKCHEELRWEYYNGLDKGCFHDSSSMAWTGTGADSSGNHQVQPAAGGGFVLCPASHDSFPGSNGMLGSCSLIFIPDEANRLVPYMIKNMQLSHPPVAHTPYVGSDSGTNSNQTQKQTVDISRPVLNSFTFKSSDPFGGLSKMPQLSFRRSSSETPQLSIRRSSETRSMSPPRSRTTSILTSSPTRNRIQQARRFFPKNNAQVLWDPNETFLPNVAFTPRVNPRSLFISASNIISKNVIKDVGVPDETISSSCGSKKSNEEIQATTYKNPESVTEDCLVPKLSKSDYYVEPSIPELLTRERIGRGYCSKVENFIVGRKGYGEMRFIGATDVRGLDICDIVQFDKNEVFVYIDETKKPKAGEGLNKAAEVTLFNIHSIDKNSDGPETEKMLREQTQKQGSHFISYDALAGEWKFLVEHFSRFGL